MVAVDKLLKYAEAHRGGAHQGYDQSRRDAQRNSAVHGSPAAECDRPHYEEKLAELEWITERGRLRPPNVPRCEGLGALSRGRAESLPHHGLTERFEPISMALRRRKNRAG